MHSIAGNLPCFPVNSLSFSISNSLFTKITNILGTASSFLKTIFHILLLHFSLQRCALCLN
jgi:hypothetical protein